MSISNQPYPKYVLVAVLLVSLPVGVNADERDDLQGRVEDTLKQLVRENTGGGAALQGAASALTDLLPDFNISINDGEVAGDDGVRKLAISYSPRIKDVADLGLTVALAEPEVYAGLEEMNLVSAAEIEALDEQFSLEDAVTIELQLSRIGRIGRKSYGRSLDLYQREMDALFDVAYAAAQNETALERQRIREQRDKRLRALRDVGCQNYASALLSGVNVSAPTEASLRAAIDQFDTQLRQEPNAQAVKLQECRDLAMAAVPAFLEFTHLSNDYVATLDSNLRALGVFGMARMVNKQPQLILSASVVEQDSLAGPDEYSVRLTWETGLGNGSLNDLKNSNAWRNCQTSDAQSCIEAVEILTNKVNELGIPSNQWRFALSGEYTHRDNQRIALNDPMLAVDIDGDESLAVTAALYVKSWLNGSKVPYVFELAGSYEMNDSDAMQDRAIFSLTGSRNLADGLALSLGLVWANRPEFRGAADKELSARVGLNYKLSFLE